MADVLRIAATVATPLSLLGLLAALGYYIYSRRLKHEEKSLGTLPLEERVRIVDQRLSRYGIDGSNFTRAHKALLILDEMEKRYRFARLCTILFAVVFVLCFGIASLAFIWTPRPDDQHPNRIENLQDQLADLKARAKTSDAMLESLIT